MGTTGKSIILLNMSKDHSLVDVMVVSILASLDACSTIKFSHIVNFYLRHVSAQDKEGLKNQ